MAHDGEDPRGDVTATGVPVLDRERQHVTQQHVHQQDVRGFAVRSLVERTVDEVEVLGDDVGDLGDPQHQLHDEPPVRQGSRGRVGGHAFARPGSSNP